MLNYLASLPGALAQGLIWGIMAVGLYISYKVLDFADLTVDGSLATGAAVCAVLVTSGCPVGLAIVAALVAGMLAGLATGLFHTAMGIPPILSGILTQLILWSVNLKIMGRANTPLSARQHPLIVAQLYKGQSIWVAALFAAALIGVFYVFFGTELGAAIRATGSNAAMSRAQGIHTKKMTVLALMISNGVVAMAGALLAQYLGQADINIGRGAIVIGLAAIIIGEALLGRLSRNFAFQLATAVIGGVLYYLVYQTVIYLGLDTDLLKALSAVVVAVFLAIPYWKKKHAERTKTEVPHA